MMPVQIWWCKDWIFGAKLGAQIVLEWYMHLLIGLYMLYMYIRRHHPSFCGARTRTLVVHKGPLQTLLQRVIMRVTSPKKLNTKFIIHSLCLQNECLVSGYPVRSKTFGSPLAPMPLPGQNEDAPT